MAAADVTSTILQIASQIQEWGNDWYKASAAWDDFPRQVSLRRRKNEFWQAGVSEFGMLSDSSLMEALREAKVLLAAEQVKLEKRQDKGTITCFRECCPKLSMTVFPGKVGLSIQAAINAFDAIPGFLELEEENHAILQKRLLRRPPSLAFRGDEHNRYVHLEVSESEIHSALTKPEGHNVILLHGGAGRGKSTLARHIALHYHEHASKGKGPYARVVYLECGRKAEILAKQTELLQLFGWDPADQGQQDSHSSIPKLLAGTLKCQKILIIFDDVWDGKFLQGIVDLCGNEVKCLVTSQNGNLCQGLNFFPTIVKIRVDKEDSKKILASHAGFSSQLIPDRMEDLVDKLLDETEGHPLALALIATWIDPKRCNEVEQWEYTSSNFLQLLHSECTAHVLGTNYPKSLFSAMKLSIQALSNDAEKLLVLVHLCDGPSVPEEVVRVLYTSNLFQKGPTLFDKLRMELESQELVKITIDIFDSTHSRKLRGWSIHSLQHLFIENEMSHEKIEMLKEFSRSFDEMDSMSKVEPKIMSKISTDNEEAMTLIILCSLYLGSHFAEKVASKIEVSVQRFDNLRKSVIQPISRLLGLPMSARWTSVAQSSARLVFLTYICNGDLHDDAISFLLDLQLIEISVLPMLSTLRNIANAEHTSLINENTRRLVKALLRLFGYRDAHCNINYAAATAIAKLAVNASDSALLASSGAFDEALKLFLSEFDPGLQLVPALKGIMFGGDEESNLSQADVETHLDFPDFFNIPDDLLYLSSKYNSPLLQLIALIVLAPLLYRGTDEMRLKINNSAITLDQLVACLRKDSHPILQKAAAMVLGDVLFDANDRTKLKIISFPGALDGLIQCLSKDSHPALQAYAALALGRLAETEMVNFPGALKQLTLSLSKDNNSQLQQHAAWTFHNLAGSDETNLKIVNFPGALDGLIQCLSKDSDPALQAYAACALARLAETEMVNFPGALEQLTLSLSKDNNSQLEQHAASTFHNLAGSDETNLKIVNFPGALDGLIQCLSKDSDPALQERAGMALSKLANVDRTTLKITNFGTVDMLDSNPVLHEQLAAAVFASRMMSEIDKPRDEFGNLSEQHMNAWSETLLQMLNSPSMVEQLRDSLCNRGHPFVQMVAAQTIACFFRGSLIRHTDSIEKMITFMTCDDVMDGLLGLLTEQVSEWTHGTAAMALTYIVPTQGNKARLYCPHVYYQRAHANFDLDLYQEALADLEKANELRPRNQDILRRRRKVKARLEDFSGALADADYIIEVQRRVVDLQDKVFSFDFQERGVLKVKMGDLQGAMADLDEGLDIAGDDYEILKHRGYVAFLMKDEEKACFYAERALKIQQPGFDLRFKQKNCLGTSPVEYLDYKL